MRGFVRLCKESSLLIPDGTRVLFVPSRDKKALLVFLRVFSFERSKAEAFAVPFRVLNRKNAGQELMCSFKNCR